MNAQTTSQPPAPCESKALIPTTPFVIQAQKVTSRYTFDDVLAMRFGIEDGSQLLISGRAGQASLEFAQPLRITQEEYNHPLSVV